MHSFGPFWSNGVKKREIDLFCCISMTNNVKSYKQINGRAQIQWFYKGTSGALCWKCYKPQKLGKLKHLILNSKVYNICHFWYFWPRTWGLKNWKSPLNGQTSKLSQTYSVTYQNLCEKGTKPMTMALCQWQKKLVKRMTNLSGAYASSKLLQTRFTKNSYNKCNVIVNSEPQYNKINCFIIDYWFAFLRQMIVNFGCWRQKILWG